MSWWYDDIYIIKQNLKGLDIEHEVFQQDVCYDVFSKFV